MVPSLSCSSSPSPSCSIYRLLLTTLGSLRPTSPYLLPPPGPLKHSSDGCLGRRACRVAQEADSQAASGQARHRRPARARRSYQGRRWRLVRRPLRRPVSAPYKWYVTAEPEYGRDGTGAGVGLNRAAREADRMPQKMPTNPPTTSITLPLRHGPPTPTPSTWPGPLSPSCDRPT